VNVRLAEPFEYSQDTLVQAIYRIDRKPCKIQQIKIGSTGLELDINRMAELIDIAESIEPSEIGGFIKKLETPERIFVQNQIALKDKYSDKLPEIFRLKGIILPTRLSLQQASSESTAAYKSKVISFYLKDNNIRSYIDITGGLGVDFTVIALSLLEKKIIDEALYVEQDKYLYNIYKYNLSIISRKYPSLYKIKIFNSDSEEVLRDIDIGKSFVYADPARRDNKGKKVFLLEDCSPDLAMISDKYDPNHFMYKLSPILDIDYIQKKIDKAKSFYCVENDRELKEILAFSTDKELTSVHVVKVSGNNIVIELAFERSSDKHIDLFCRDLKEHDIILLPSPAVSKSGVLENTNNYGLSKISENTNIYYTDKIIDDEKILGRYFRVVELFKYKRNKKLTGGFNIISKNFTDNPTQIANKLKVDEGGYRFLIAFRNNEKKHQIALCDIIV
jgi:hypothetical protein